jgi:hypothetical protein
MSDPVKIEAVRGYLQTAFPDHDIRDRSRRVTDHDFTVSRGGVSYRVTVKQTFLDDHTPEEIACLLDDWRLVSSVRKAETACVIVGNGGIAAAYP